MASSVHCRAYRFGSFVLDLGRGALLGVNCKELPLRPKSFELLRLLVENEGCLLSRETIMERLWPNIFVTENNVTQCIHDIRDAFGPDAHKLLRTMPRRGYIFVADVILLPWPHSARCAAEIPSDGAMTPTVAAHREDGQRAANDNEMRPQSGTSPPRSFRRFATSAPRLELDDPTRHATAGSSASAAPGEPTNARL